MLESIGIHLTIAGGAPHGRNCRTEDEDGNIYDQGEVWEIVSVLEVKVTGTNWSIDYGDGHPVVKPLRGTTLSFVSGNQIPPSASRQTLRSVRYLILSEIEWLTPATSSLNCLTPGRCWHPFPPAGW